MESIKTKITMAAQQSRYKVVQYTDIAGGAAQAYGPETSDQCKIIVPKGAIIIGTPILTTTAWAGPSTVLATTGHVAKSLDETGASLASAAIDDDAYYDGTTSVAAKGLIGTGIIGAGNTGARLGKEVSYTVTNSGDKEYSVGLYLTMGNTAATSAGYTIWWVEYMFAPNIVWAQADLA
tara:strand:+ start:37 stop:573 length:537 start_codon:yes stop_codon:yes gene_type:complete